MYWYGWLVTSMLGASAASLISLPAPEKPAHAILAWMGRSAPRDHQRLLPLPRLVYALMKMGRCERLLGRGYKNTEMII
jgi:hypothetical protein